MERVTHQKELTMTKKELRRIQKSFEKDEIKVDGGVVGKLLSYRKNDVNFPSHHSTPT